MWQSCRRDTLPPTPLPAPSSIHRPSWHALHSAPDNPRSIHPRLMLCCSNSSDQGSWASAVSLPPPWTVGMLTTPPPPTGLPGLLRGTPTAANSPLAHSPPPPTHPPVTMSAAPQCSLARLPPPPAKVNADISHYNFRQIKQGKHLRAILDRVGHTHQRMVRTPTQPGPPAGERSQQQQCRRHIGPGLVGGLCSAASSATSRPTCRTRPPTGMRRA